MTDGGEAALGEAYASLMQSISRSKASHRSSAALLSGRLHSAEEETLQAACPSAAAGSPHKVVPPHEGTLRALGEPTPVSLRSSSRHGADPSPAATVLDEPEELPPPPAALAPLLLAKGKDAQRRGGARDEPASSAETGGGETGVCDISSALWS